MRNLASLFVVVACGIVVSAAPPYDSVTGPTMPGDPGSTVTGGTGGNTGSTVTGGTGGGTGSTVSVGPGPTTTTVPPTPLPKPKAGPGAKEPKDNLPWTTTRGKSASEISEWNGMALEVLSTSLLWLKKAYKTCAELAKVPEENGPDVVVGGNAVRFYQTDPLITINFNINEVTFYQHRSSFATTGNIGRNIDRLFQNLCNDNKVEYAAAVDYIGQLHHKFAIDPTIKQNTDLGLFLKDADAHVRGIAACISHDEWNEEIYRKMMQPLRYIRWSTWHISQMYSLQRNCFRQADPTDGARVRD